ncbi:hypothetical protein [Nocardia paucivorans]|uniref:hypothetical protein n=1 Tax=Nocardia paucivorans TaxID=114259 RepID=UPI00059457BB|nr:hypothetical protein [Nocardia paucivorans]
MTAKDSPLETIFNRLALDMRERAKQVTRSMADRYRTAGDLMCYVTHLIEHPDTGSTHVLWEVPPGRLRPRPNRPSTHPYQPSAAETAMAERRLVGDVESNTLVGGGEAASATIRKMRSTDGAVNIYKPERGEDYDGLFHFRPYRGAQTDREIAAYRLDEILGFNRIPPTARTAGPPEPDGDRTGPGMIQ